MKREGHDTWRSWRRKVQCHPVWRRRIVGVALAGLTLLVTAATSTSAGAAPLTVAHRSRLPAMNSGALSNGVVEHRALAMYGIPVRGAYERVFIAADGSERVLVARRPDAEPQLRPEQARVHASALSTILAAHPRTQAAPEPADPPQLVYRMILGEPVLAWEVSMPLTIDPEPSRLRVWVSAATGRVLHEREEVFASRARVFKENPSITPDPVEVELDIDATGPGIPLDGPRVAALNCVSEPPQDPDDIFPWWDEDECYAVTGLLSDIDGNYFPKLPEIIYPADSVVVDDAYSQLSIYYHSQRFFTRFAELGVASFACEKSTMLANFHDTLPSGALDYTPLNNAFYTNECDIEDGPTMIFGQGSEVDFAYDGDVVYHELGHGLVAHLSPDGLVDQNLRHDGSLSDARGINEALADYFSVVLTDDPNLADYVGRYSSGGGNQIRDAENNRVCPANMSGQEHNDGEPFMAALWATRKRIGGAQLDPLVLQMLMRLPSDASLEVAAATLLEVAQAEYEVDTLAQSDLDFMVRALGSRGLLDCPRVISDPARVQAGHGMHLRRRTSGVQPFYPGPLQLRYEVPQNVQHAFVRFKLTASRSANPVEARVLVRREDSPITYEYHLVAADEEVELPEDGGEPDDPDPVREVILTTGDWDEELVPVQYAVNEYEAQITGLSEGKVLHIAVVNVSTTAAVASGVRVQSTAALADEPEPEADTDVPDPAQDGTDVVASGDVASGACTCRAASHGPRRGAWVWWMVPAGLVLARRSNRGRRSGPAR
ncbi:MAG: hypothetical protein JKY37_10225 [Nannocystaceae bacterium]|nr:hypothetical protein [Nannocystaceae bacterium]